jgi:hypothetical protein
MKIVLLLALLYSSVYGVDYSSMFLTSERENAYSSLKHDPELEKEAYYNALESKGGRYARKSSIRYQAHLALENHSDFEDNGYAVVLSALKAFPKMFPKYVGIFAQADLLYTFNDLTSKNGAIVKDEIALSAYGGYEHAMDAKLTVSGRFGSSFITGDSSFALSYGVGARYNLGIPGYQAVANVLIVDELWVVTAGVEFTL